jgi:uncharacterized membrane protein
MKQPQELRPAGRRLEAFSDAVFAIVVTIMVFEIRVPDVLAVRWDPAAFRPLAALLIAYALSFFVVTNLWTSHQYLVFTVTKPTRTTVWLNNLLLFCVTIVPITTRFLGLHPNSSMAAAAYGLGGMAITISYMLLRAHAIRIVESDDHRAIHLRVFRLSWLFLALYALSIALAFLSPWAAWACFIAVPVMVFFLPLMQARRAQGAAAHPLERSCP